MTRIIETTGLLVEHLSGKHDQRLHGRGHGAVLAPQDAIESLAAGRGASIAPGDVGAVMDLAAGRPDNPDLTELRVEGTLKFGGDGMGLARKDMPQLPADRLPAYLGELRERGVSVSRVDAKPQTLKPIQKEVSAAASARILQSVRRDEFDFDAHQIVVSRDNFVLDGHHRWGAVVARSFEQPSFTVKVTKIGMSGSDLLKDALAWTEDQGIAKRALGEARLAEHLGGKHDQLTHGRRRGGGKLADKVYPPSSAARGTLNPDGSVHPGLLRAVAGFPKNEREHVLAVAAGTTPPTSLGEVPLDHTEHFDIHPNEANEELEAIVAYRDTIKLEGQTEYGEMLDAAGGVIAYTYPANMIYHLQGLSDDAFVGLREAAIKEHLAGKHDQKLHGRGRLGGRESLRRVEHEIKGISGGETLVVLDKDGNEVFRRSAFGDPDGDGPAQAGMSTGDVDPSVFAGNIVTHNHPTADLGEPATAFSMNDVASAASYGVGELRVVNPDGTVFVMKPGPDGWPPSHTLAFQTALSEMVVGSHVADLVSSGKLPEIKANAEYHHLLNTQIADVFGLSYEVTHVDMG